MKYSNGDTYEGVFEYDLRSKQGKMTYKNGSVYEGSWANGLVTIDCLILIHLIFVTTNEPLELLCQFNCDFPLSFYLAPR